VVPTPALGPAPAAPRGAATTVTFAVPIEPYRAELTHVSGVPPRPQARATVRHPWNRTDSRLEPYLWLYPQAISLRYAALPVELAAHTTWLGGGGALRIWGHSPEPGGFGAALVIEGQHGYWAADWRLGGMAEVHRRFRQTSGWVGVGASTGLRRHHIDLPDVIAHGPDAFEGSIGDFAPYDFFVLRPETRLDGSVGGSLDVGRAHAYLSLAPYYVLHAGALQHQDEIGYIRVDSFSSSYGVILELTLHLELAGLLSSVR